VVPAFQQRQSERPQQELLRLRPSCAGFLTIHQIHTIFEDTIEIQQLVIARAISGLRIE
jgi:hypothetical protein